MESPSLYSTMKASIHRACRHPPSLCTNSRKGATTASRRLRGRWSSSTISGIHRVVNSPTPMKAATTQNTDDQGR